MTLTTEAPFDFDYSYEPGEPADRDYPGSAPEIRITGVSLYGVALPLERVSGELLNQMIEQAHEEHA
jgi:hypothetical protein